MTNKKQVELFKNHFRILDKWEIEYVNGIIEAYYLKKSSLSRDYKNNGRYIRKMWIYPFAEKGRANIDYILHEMLHACERELKYGNKYEISKKWELFIQDVCSLLFRIKK